MVFGLAESQHDLFALKLIIWDFDLQCEGQMTKIDLQWPPISELTTDLDSATPKTIEKTPNMTYLCWKWKIKILTSNVTSISGFFWMEVNSMFMIPFSEVRLIYGLPAKTKKVKFFFIFGAKLVFKNTKNDNFWGQNGGQWPPIRKKPNFRCTLGSNDALYQFWWV